jgi:hypothetical protein
MPTRNLFQLHLDPITASAAPADRTQQSGPNELQLARA